MVLKIKKILLVEDSPNDAELTMEALGEHGLDKTVEWVKDGQQALDYLNYEGSYADRCVVNPILILLDLKLPKVHGLELLRHIRSDDNLKYIPVVALTSSREASDLLKSYKLGINAYVVKPVDFQEFMTAVKELGTFWAIVNEPPPHISR